MHKKINLGFIGGGISSAIGAAHFSAIQIDGLFQLQAGCFSRNLKINQLTAEKWGVNEKSVYGDWRNMLEAEKEKLDAIVVLTPTPEHFEPVIAAVKLGYPVICEKSLAENSADAAVIKSAVSESGGFLAVTYNYTGYPMVRELRQMINSGKLGKLEQVHIEMPQEGFSRLDKNGNPMIPQQWRLSDGTIPIISLDLGVHMHNLVSFLTNEKALEVVATQHSFGRFKQVVDNAMILARYSNELVCNYWYSKVALGNRNGLRVRVYGDKGAAEWYQMEPEYILYADNSGNQLKIDRTSSTLTVASEGRYNRFKAGHPAGFIEAFANIYADVGEQLKLRLENNLLNSDYVFSATQALEGLMFFEAVNVSANTHKWVSVN